MPKRKPRKPYKGILAVPTPRGGDAVVRPVLIRKMLALLDHHEIDRDRPDNWFQLAYAMAGDHVPGFDPPQRQGRKSAPAIKRDFNLLHQLGWAELREGSINNAVRQIAHKKTGKGGLNGMSPEALRNQYYRLKDPKSKDGKRIRWFLDASAASEEFRRSMFLNMDDQTADNCMLVINYALGRATREQVLVAAKKWAAKKVARK